ncbi:MAG: hypothetical protein CMP08_05585 [Xanthomonadales bacterium]|nr:hypothetical protein [Xanthomonadales bacterium]
MSSGILWFKNDLRLDDNPALVAAAGQVDRLICVYCIDAHFEQSSDYGGAARVGPHRSGFIAQALIDLDQQLADRQQTLLTVRGEPEEVLPRIAAFIEASAVWAEIERAPDEAAQLGRVSARLPAGCALVTTEDNTLYRLADLPYDDLADVPATFTRFRKTIESTIDNRVPVAAPETLPGAAELSTLVSELALESVDVGPWLPANPRFSGGERAGQARLAHYLFDTDAIADYKQTRNGLLGDDYSSKFSPWLASGCLSARRIAEQVRLYEARQTANQSTYWLVFELRWREFFHWTLARVDAELFSRGGIIGRDDRPTATDGPTIAAWQAGRTGMPFVDANMKELAATGYMSNRGRQNVASFFARDLAQDWRWGAAWFESQLVDYDVASNWCNWATVAGVGTDKRDNGFNVLSQAKRYDAKAEYVLYWLPELEAVPAKWRHTPWLADADTLAAIGYPRLAHIPRDWGNHLPD